ncbi:MAG TPA: hypothetical protein DER07_03030 [Armatimonadetes bacterium]|nr:hypothetical protein [Armatimonadota bacterium]
MQDRKTLVIVLAVVAVLAAALSIYSVWSGSQGKPGAYYGSKDPNAPSPKSQMVQSDMGSARPKDEQAADSPGN